MFGTTWHWGVRHQVAVVRLAFTGALMPYSVVIRSELPDDAPAISRITQLAFESSPHSSHTEQFIIQALRQADVLSLSLVAEVGSQVVGHIAFSPVQITDGSQQWYGLGPLAVAPELQRQGIGTALVNAGLAALRVRGAEGCVVLGEPQFYRRFGFRSRPECVLEDVPEKYFQSQSFGPRAAIGKVTYHQAFSAQS